MLWSLAFSALQLRDFELTVTSLELLLAGCLLIGSTFQIPVGLEKDVMRFLLTGARPKENMYPPISTTPQKTPAGTTSLRIKIVVQTRGPGTRQGKRKGTPRMRSNS